MEVTIPDDDFFGDFVNNVDYAAFGLWDDSENSGILAFIDYHDFTNANFSEPTGEVFGGTVGFIEEFDETDSIVVCIYGPSYDDKGWCTGTDGEEFFTMTLDPENLPEDGEGDWNVEDFGTKELNAVYFDTEYGAGIG